MSRKSRRSAQALAAAGPPTAAPARPWLRNPWLRRWGPALALALLTFLFLCPALDGIYIWDDPDWLTHNPMVTQGDHLVEIWTNPAASPQYYPLVFTTFWVEYRLWGLGISGTDGLYRGVGYHLDNLLLHIASAILIYEILKGLQLPGRNLGAWLSAAVFAIHPVNVESVAWVAERKNVLSGFFFFAALYAGLCFFRVTANPTLPTSKEPDPEPNPSNWALYAIAVLCFILALFSKTTAAVLAPIFLLMIWWRRGSIRWREILLSLPFFAIGLAMGALTSFVETNQAGSAGPEWHFTFLQRVLIAGTDLWFYLEKLLLPYPVMQIYPRFDIVAGKPVTFWWYYAAPVLYLLLLAILWVWRKKISRGPLTAMLFFAGAALPALGFINFYTMTITFVADHYQYLACIGVIVLAVELLLMAIKWASARVPVAAGEDADRARARFLGLLQKLVCGGLILALGGLSFGVADLYTDGRALWGFNAEHNPASSAPLENLASAFLNKQPANLPAAKAAMEKALLVSPDEWHGWEALGSFYLEKGSAEHDAGAKGLAMLLKADELMPTRIKAGRAAFLAARAKYVTTPGSQFGGQFTTGYGPHYLVGKFYEQREQWPQAIEQYKLDVAENPQNVEALFNLGNCYMGLNDAADAKVWLKRALAQQPKYAAAWLSLGVCLARLGDLAEGKAAIEQAVNLDINVARQYPAMARALRGMGAENKKE